MSPLAAERAGEAVERRMAEKGVRSSRALSRATGLDYRTIAAIIAGRKTQVSASTLAVLEVHLEWPARHLTALIVDANREYASSFECEGDPLALDVPDGMVVSVEKVRDFNRLMQVVFDEYFRAELGEAG